MLIQVIRSGISVLLHDPSGFSMPGYLSLAIRRRAFYTNFLSYLTYNFLLCRSDCAITTYRNVYLLNNSKQFRTFRNYFSFSDALYQ